MHKVLANSLALDFVIQPDGPILIKSGLTDPDRAGDNAGGQHRYNLMEFVRTYHPDGGNTIYLPGSSLKGVIRDRVEQIIRTVGLYACDPPQENGGCSAHIEENWPGPVIYNELCAACRIFGSTKMASRFHIQDAYPEQPIELNASDQRALVAIDRRTGAVAQGPFSMEVATRGKFHTRIEMHNFELWQIGVLALALRDLLLGDVRVGFGKSRGFGKVKLTYESLRLSYTKLPRTADVANNMYGAGSLLSGTELAQAYQFTDPDEQPLGVVGRVESDGLRTHVHISPREVETALSHQVPAWAAKVPA